MYTDAFTNPWKITPSDSSYTRRFTSRWDQITRQPHKVPTLPSKAIKYPRQVPPKVISVVTSGNSCGSTHTACSNQASSHRHWSCIPYKFYSLLIRQYKHKRLTVNIFHPYITHICITLINLIAESSKTWFISTLHFPLEMLCTSSLLQFFPPWRRDTLVSLKTHQPLFV